MKDYEINGEKTEYKFIPNHVLLIRLRSQVCSVLESVIFTVK